MCQCENQCSDPRRQVKARQRWCPTCDPRSRGEGTRVPPDNRLARPAAISELRVQKRLSLSKYGGENWKKIPAFQIWPPHARVYICSLQIQPHLHKSRHLQKCEHTFHSYACTHPKRTRMKLDQHLTPYIGIIVQ